MIAKLHSDVLLIPRKLHYLICGRKRATLKPIIEETLINIYFPSPLLDLDTTTTTEDNGDHTTTIDDKPPIYITGDATNVSRVQDMLTKLANQKAKSMYHKDSNLDARKLDWMQVHRRNDICQIMHDNGSFIDFPPHGSKSSVVTVYAENRVNAERTLRSINFLACQIYEACFYFHNRDDMYSDATFFNSINNLAGLTTALSQVSGAEVAYRTDPGCIQVFGTENNIRNIYQHLHETTFSKIYHQDTIFNVELSNDQREFISGKKNGKINKIMKTSGAKIKFLPFGEYNFILEVESSSFVKALDGLTLLQEELPAEISFYVPESYHKRIIGVGGKNIQRIMKKYGVYVKFSNAEEFASLGGYYGNEDNVVARTPMKNKTNLDNLRQAVTPKDKDFVVQRFSIPFRRHRTLLGDYHIYLQEVANKTSSKIIWPNHELASDILTLVGPQCDLESMTQILRHMVTDTYCFRVPMSTKLISVLSSANFEDQVTRPLQHEMNVSVNVIPVLENGAKMKINDAIGDGGQQQSTATLYSSIDRGDLNGICCTIPLTMNKAHLDCLPAALDMLIRYLRKNQVPLYKDPINDSTDNRILSSRDNPTTDYGNHPFKSKLLSSIIPAELPLSTSTLPFQQLSTNSNKNVFQPYSLFDYPSTSDIGTNNLNAPWKGLRDDNNIRAIFDSPYETHGQDTRFGTGVTGPTSHTQMKSYMNGFNYHGGLASHSTPTSSNNLDIWLNNPQSGFQNGFSTITSPPLTAISSNDLCDQSQHMTSEGTDPTLYWQGYAPAMGGNGFTQRPTSTTKSPGDHHGLCVKPTSSTSSESNNSLNSTKSMPESSIDLRHGSYQILPQRPRDESSAITTATSSTLSPTLFAPKAFEPDIPFVFLGGRDETGDPPNRLHSSRSSSVAAQYHHRHKYQQDPSQQHRYHQQQQQPTSPPPPPFAYPSSVTTFSMSPSSSSATRHSPLSRPLPSSISTPMIHVAPSTTASSSNVIGSGVLPGTTMETNGLTMEYSSFYSPIKESNFDSLLGKISLGSSDQENTMGPVFAQYQNHPNERRN
ncbi:unnamed protein product [Absidia cylindrospora]